MESVLDVDDHNRERPICNGEAPHLLHFDLFRLEDEHTRGFQSAAPTIEMFPCIRGNAIRACAEPMAQDRGNLFRVLADLSRQRKRWRLLLQLLQQLQRSLPLQADSANRQSQFRRQDRVRWSMGSAKIRRRGLFRWRMR